MVQHLGKTNLWSGSWYSPGGSWERPCPNESWRHNENKLTIKRCWLWKNLRLTSKKHTFIIITLVMIPYECMSVFLWLWNIEGQRSGQSCRTHSESSIWPCNPHWAQLACRCVCWRVSMTRRHFLSSLLSQYCINAHVSSCGPPFSTHPSLPRGGCLLRGVQPCQSRFLSNYQCPASG